MSVSSCAWRGSGGFGATEPRRCAHPNQDTHRDHVREIVIQLVPAMKSPASFRSVMAHTLRLAEKDLEQSIVLAKRTGVDVPIFDTAQRTFARVVRL